MNEDIAKKYARLIDRLSKKTNDKLVSWTLDEDRSPRAVVGDYVISLYSGSQGGNPVEYMTLSTKYDELIERIDDEDLNDCSPGGGPFDTYYEVMTRLREQAFRQAVGADKALDQILGDLDDDL